MYNHLFVLIIFKPVRFHLLQDSFSFTFQANLKKEITCYGGRKRWTLEKGWTDIFAEAICNEASVIK